MNVMDLLSAEGHNTLKLIVLRDKMVKSFESHGITKKMLLEVPKDNAAFSAVDCKDKMSVKNGSYSFCGRKL